MKSIFNRSIVFLFALCAGQTSFAQLSPMGAMYFQNQYLGNPALVGTAQGMDVNLGVRKQWSTLPGSPASQTFTTSYGATEKVGLGLLVANDKSGLFKTTRAMASYAYHLPLNASDRKLSFGLSLGFMTERIATEDIQGNPADLSIGNFNQRDTYFDGDFGIAYSSQGFNIQAAVPNLKTYLKKDDFDDVVDRVTFMSALSYRVNLSGNSGFGLEPKVAYRGIKGMDGIVDAGANLSYANNKLNIFGMYHSTKSTTFGVGLNYQTIGFTGMYSTATSALSNYTNGNFELSMKVRLFK